MFILCVETRDLIMICQLSLPLRDTSIQEQKRYEEFMNFFLHHEGLQARPVMDSPWVKFTLQKEAKTLLYVTFKLHFSHILRVLIEVELKRSGTWSFFHIFKMDCTPSENILIPSNTKFYMVLIIAASKQHCIKGRSNICAV